MFENSGEYFRTAEKENSALSETKESVLYEVAVMCDKYNRVLYNLFNVYSKSYSNGRFQSVDDHLAFLEDYNIVPSFIKKENAVTNFMNILSNYDNGEVLETVNFLSYEAFVESVCRIALLVFENPSLSKMYTSITEKISMLIEMWNLDDESLLTLHLEERKQYSA